MRATDATWTTWQARAGELGATTAVVLMGGTSSERSVSLESGRAMAAALGAAPPGGPPLPGSVIEVEIGVDGRWGVDGRALSPARAVEALPAEALYVLGLHGGRGEDGGLQAFLEVCGRRYTGAGPAASALCMNKRLARLAAGAAGVTLAPGRLLTVEAWSADPRAELAAIEALGGPPWFVKPNLGGSSVGLSRVGQSGDLAAAVAEALELGDDVLVEAGVAGLEVTCGVVGNRGQEPVLLPPVEILPAAGRFFDFQQKYSVDGARELCPPEHLSPAGAERVQDRALDVYRAMGCEGYGRIDFIVPMEPGERGDPLGRGEHGEQREDGDYREDGDSAVEPVFLEANTLPGFTSRSLLPQEAAVTGVGYRELCLELCARALARFEERGGGACGGGGGGGPR